MVNNEASTRHTAAVTAALAESERARHQMCGDYADLLSKQTNDSARAEAAEQRASALAARLAEVEAAPSVAAVIAWMKARPGASWIATIKDVEQAVAALAQPEGRRHGG